MFGILERSERGSGSDTDADRYADSNADAADSDGYLNINRSDTDRYSNTSRAHANVTTGTNIHSDTCAIRSVGANHTTRMSSWYSRLVRRRLQAYSDLRP